ncbi:MAG: hypothetical protein KAU12_05420 [Candidatus Omnitrophica bacterium]|nr:hypothetical protein [Candidatus Omnitrophota bacterium]
MLNIIEQIRENIPQDILTDDILMNLCEGSPDKRYGVVKRAIAKGKLVHIKRGLYHLAKKYQRKSLNLFELAQWIYGPSYVSFESALSYHGCIPESVYAVTSACSRNAREFHTPSGIFIYKRIPYPVLYLCVERVKSENGIFFMASPLRAIVDYVYAYQKHWRGIDPLIKSLRIEPHIINQWDYSLLDKLKEVYTNYRVQRFLKGLKKDLNL